MATTLKLGQTYTYVPSDGDMSLAWTATDWTTDGTYILSFDSAPPKPEAIAKTLRRGDVIKVSQTFRFEDHNAADGYMRLTLTARPEEGSYYRSVANSQIEVVKKARRQRGQFKVGQVITSETLREVMWVRGTVIESVKNGAAFVLREDGKWHDLLGNGCECKAGWPFEDFRGDYKFVRLPE